MADTKISSEPKGLSGLWRAAPVMSEAEATCVVRQCRAAISILRASMLDDTDDAIGQTGVGDPHEVVTTIRVRLGEALLQLENQPAWLALSSAIHLLLAIDWSFESVWNGTLEGLKRSDIAGTLELAADHLSLFLVSMERDTEVQHG